MIPNHPLVITHKASIPTDILPTPAGSRHVKLTPGSQLGDLTGAEYLMQSRPQVQCVPAHDSPTRSRHQATGALLALASAALRRSRLQASDQLQRKPPLSSALPEDSVEKDRFVASGALPARQCSWAAPEPGSDGSGRGECRHLAARSDSDD